MCTFYPQIIGKHESEDGDALIVIGTRHGSGEMRGIKEKGLTVHFIINIIITNQSLEGTSLWRHERNVPADIAGDDSDETCSHESSARWPQLFRQKIRCDGSKAAENGCQEYAYVPAK